MRLMLGFLFGVLVCPSTWILAAVMLFVKNISPDSNHQLQVIVGGLLILGIFVVELRELVLDVPWFFRENPPPGLHCTVYEWNNTSEGKPLFIAHCFANTAIRFAIIALLVWQIAFR